MFMTGSIASCASIKDRYDRQHFLTYESAECEPSSSMLLAENGLIKKMNEPSERERFQLVNLRRDEATEIYCGPFCEPPGVRRTYRIAKRGDDKEIFLSEDSGRRIMHVDFEGKSYRLTSFLRSGISVEAGTCTFRMPQ